MFATTLRGSDEFLGCVGLSVPAFLPEILPAVEIELAVTVQQVMGVRLAILRELAMEWATVFRRGARLLAAQKV